tara:strand:+ start:474 stop:2099 length:1626 start_codon:yes stop_codon:yes gene_type:complete
MYSKKISIPHFLRIENLLYILPIILISIYYSIYRFHAQQAVDGGLILSNIVDFPDNFSNVTGALQDSYTFLHQFTLFFLKLNFSVDLISAILMFMIIFFYTFGIYLISFGISKSKAFSLLISLASTLTRENFGNVDYPVMYFTEYTFGMFSLATFGMIVGFISNKNYKLVGLFSIILLASHIIVGIWVLFVLLVTLIFVLKFNKDYSFKIIGRGALIGIPFLIISLLFFYFNINGPENYNINDYDLYLSEWDHHRNIKTIHYKYIFKTFLLIAILTYFYFKTRSKSNSIFYFFLLFSCLGSFLLYLAYKFFPSIFPDFVVRGMPTRLFLLHSVIGYPIMITVIFYYVNYKTNFVEIISSKINKFYFSIFLTLFTIAIISKNYDKVPLKLSILKDNFSYISGNRDKIFWDKIKNTDTKGYFVTGEYSSGPLLRYGLKPYLLNTLYFDHIPGAPYTVTETRFIIENVYGVSFENPPKKHLAAVLDSWYKELFEEREESDWIKLSNKFNISGIVVPSSWKLNIEKKITSKKFTVYFLKDYKQKE